MKVSKLTASVPASFEYVYLDEKENEQKETIHLQLRKVSWAVAEDARNLAENASLHEMAETLVKIIAEWSLFIDDDETEKFPISAEWLAGPDCPAAFFGPLLNCVLDKLSGKATASSSPSASEPAVKSSAMVN